MKPFFLSLLFAILLFLKFFLLNFFPRFNSCQAQHAPKGQTAAASSHYHPSSPSHHSSHPSSPTRSPSHRPSVAPHVPLPDDATAVYCKVCGIPFALTDSEREWFSSRSIPPPRTCKPCRDKKKSS
jgi:hypothetical protein